METKERVRANTPGLSRRNLLKAAPTLALAGVVPALAGISDNRIEALYARWLAARNAYRENDFGEEREAELYKAMTDIEDEILSIRPQTTRDYAYKIIVLNDFAVLEGLPWGDAMMVEARALIGGAA